MALLRHIEGDDVTRDLITDDEWAGYLSDADYVSGLISAAGYAVVPREPTEAMILAAPGRDQQGEEESMYHGIYRAMLAASEPQP
jgi:hypothetical protein